MPQNTNLYQVWLLKNLLKKSWAMDCWRRKHWVSIKKEWGLDNIRKWKGVCIPYECHHHLDYILSQRKRIRVLYLLSSFLFSVPQSHSNGFLMALFGAINDFCFVYSQRTKEAFLNACVLILLVDHPIVFSTWSQNLSLIMAKQQLWILGSKKSRFKSLSQTMGEWYQSKSFFFGYI